MIRIDKYFATLLLLWPLASQARTFDETLRFCSTTQMWIQVLLHSGGIRGEDVCKIGGAPSYECRGVELGEGICLAGGAPSYECRGISVHQAICDFTGSCDGYDAVSLVNSVMSVCGPDVLSFGISK